MTCPKASQPCVVMPSWLLLPRMPSEPGFTHFQFPSLCASGDLAHPSEPSLLRGNTPPAPASSDTPTWHLPSRNHCDENCMHT